MKKDNVIKNILFWFFVIIGLTFSNTGLVDTALADSTHRIGGGVHYWVALDDIDGDNVDEDGYDLIFSYQYVNSGFFKIEADLGLHQEGYAGAEEMVWSPQAYFLIGKGLYGGAGIGINYSNGDFAKKPFYALRVGIDIEVLPSLFLDLNANYRFENWDYDRIKEDVDIDTVTVGAILRLQF